MIKHGFIKVDSLFLTYKLQLQIPVTNIANISNFSQVKVQSMFY